MSGIVVLRRKRSKSAPQASEHQAPVDRQPERGDKVTDALVLPDETPLELLRPSRSSNSPARQAISDSSPSASRETEGVDVFLHRTDRGTWVITPLAGSNLELRPRSDGLPPPGCKGVIWRLDDQVLQTADEELIDDEDFMLAEKSSARAVARRLEKLSSGMRRLRQVTVKLEEKFTRFQEEKLELERKQRRLKKSLEDSAKEHAELKALRGKLEEEQKQFQEEKTRFDEEVRKNTDELAQSKGLALSTGHVAVLPPPVLFLAAQDEFLRGIPELSVTDQASYKGVCQKPEASFSSACSLFFAGNGVTGVEALVLALLSCHCMLEAQAPKVFQNLEQLLGLSQALARSANVDGRLRLSFAASSCALWCSLQLCDVLAKKWDEVNAPEYQDLILEEQDFGLMYKRLKLLSSAGSSMKRSQKSLGDYWDHRRRFIRCLAPEGGASEADLRLLFLPFRDVKATELAAHVRRLSGVVEDLVVESRKRSEAFTESASKRPKPSSRL